MTTDEFDGFVPWLEMDVPSFHTKLVDDRKRTTLVITLGEDIPHVRDRWASAPESERADLFWALGIVHLCEVEITKLPEDIRQDALRQVGRPGDAHPREIASRLAKLVREGQAREAAELGNAPARVQRSRSDNERYRRVLTIRAAEAYRGPDPDVIVCMQAGLVGEV